MVVKPQGACSGLTFGFTGQCYVGLRVWHLIPEMGDTESPHFLSLGLLKNNFIEILFAYHKIHFFKKKSFDPIYY